MITQTIRLAVVSSIALAALTACSEPATDTPLMPVKDSPAAKADDSKANESEALAKGTKFNALPTTQAPELKFSEADIARHKEAAHAAALRALEVERAKQAAKAGEKAR